MCTASWLIEKDGYQVFFNRDEQKGRLLAEPPKPFIADNGVRYLMPVDPQGGGSWIAVNEHGLTICLLNFYQGTTPQGKLISRGQLVKQLIRYSDGESLFNALTKHELHHFAPFTLVAFDKKISEEKGQVKALQWDGKSLVDSLPLPPLISSAVDAENVRNHRRDLFHKHRQYGDSVDSRLAFHHSHDPIQGHLSPCMHREDAHTVSFTHVRVNSEVSSIHYQEGSPCRQNPFHNQQINCKQTQKKVSS